MLAPRPEPLSASRLDILRIVSRKTLGDTHRQIGEAEHGLEQQMLTHADADAVPDPEYIRERARRISRSGDRHLAEARRLSDDVSGGDPTFDPARDPQDGP